MLKTFKYRIYPTSKQEKLLDATLGICCELYNSALQERRDAYRIAGVSINYHAQAIQLPEIKKVRDDLNRVHSQALQDVLKRLDKAFQAFFRRLKAGEKAGFPRFRARSRYDTFTYPQTGFEIKANRLALSKIGHVKIVLHRAPEGKIKTCTITRTATGKWFACFSCEVEPVTLPASVEAVGIDAGLKSFAVLSNGEHIENPRFFRKEEKELARVQRKLAAAPKGSIERRKRRHIVARVHERITNKRSNFAHQQSHRVVAMFGVIIVESLRVANLVQNSRLSKSINDAAWSQFFSCLSYKAEWAGRIFREVNAAYTSQDCSRCQHRQAMPLSERVYRCPNCGLNIDRDHNASLNILGLGLQTLGLAPIEAASLAC